MWVFTWIFIWYLDKHSDDLHKPFYGYSYAHSEEHWCESIHMNIHKRQSSTHVGLSSNSKKEAPIGVPGTSKTECAHPNGWRDKHTHTHTIPK